MSTSRRSKGFEKVQVGKRGDGTLIRVEGQANWFSVICVRGKQHEISTGTPDLKLAKRFHRQKLDELAADRQGLRQFTTPQHRQLQFGFLLDDLVSDYRVLEEGRDHLPEVDRRGSGCRGDSTPTRGCQDRPRPHCHAGR